MKKKITAILMAALMLTGSISGVYAAEPGKNQKQNQQVTVSEIPDAKEAEKNEADIVNKEIPETEPEAPETEIKAPETEPEAPETEIKAPETEVRKPETEVKKQTELPFKDVDENDWYYEAVSEMYTKGIIDKSADEKFCPEEDITGIELLTMLYRADGKKDDSKDNVISWAKKNKILLEDDGWEFESDKSLKREQVMVIVYRYLVYKGINMTNNDDLSSFTDKDKISSYAKEAVSSLASKGIISKSSGTVRPDEALTKAEAASIVVIVLKLIG